MNKAYIVGHITVTHPEGYAQYARQVPETIHRHGGRYIVRGGASTVLEGAPAGERHVVLEFPSLQAAQSWYHSPEYQSILALRQANSTGELMLVEGYTDPI
jgi:uncharacterized protein (DUF1330 family)